MDHVAQLIVLTLAAGTPLVYAALGELVTEKSGVLNLGVEGMMVVGAVTSFIVAATTQSPWLGVAAGMTAGAALSLIFGMLTLSLMANQVASGLALSLFGIGLSAFVGLNYISVVIVPITPLASPSSATCRWSASCSSGTTRSSTFRWSCSWRSRRSCTVRAPGSSFAPSANPRNRHTRSASPSRASGTAR